MEWNRKIKMKLKAGDTVIINKHGNPIWYSDTWPAKIEKILYTNCARLDNGGTYNLMYLDKVENKSK